MKTEAIIATLKKEFGNEILAEVTNTLDPWIAVTPEAHDRICLFLRDDGSLQMDTLNCITAVDYPVSVDKDEDNESFEPHMIVVYHISSIAQKHRIVLKVRIPRWKNGIEGQLPELPSVMSVWETADWHERETYDLSGICFTGRGEVRRILLPEDWNGYPLRKDYEPPTEYHGVSNE